MPEWSPPSSSSRAEQSMPSDAAPRIFDFLILSPPGSSAPTSATATVMPARTFGAPHTMSSTGGAADVDAREHELVGVGVLRTSSTRPTTTFW